jgi:hypothetical protein
VKSGRKEIERKEEKRGGKGKIMHKGEKEGKKFFILRGSWAEEK